uniref:SH2 domain-containing protein n=1 Tax=Denticeps clupeoides TaxID=299321 RepID=A0AAY4AR42_9TELE
SSEHNPFTGAHTKEATERLLECGQDGDFLLRDIESVQGALCLCVRYVTYGSQVQNEWLINRHC